MARRKKREFCIWVVPPHDGRVRKVRFTKYRLAASGLVLGLFTGTLLYIAGDYARVQWQRAQNHLAMRSLAGERDSLQESNERLARKLGVLRDHHAVLSGFEKDVRARLGKLESLISSATGLDVSAEGLNAEAKTSESAMGGLETECEEESGRCEQSVEPQAGLEDVALRRSARLGADPGLVHALDHYVDIVSRLPLGLPGRGDISSYYGPRRSPFTGRKKLHHGIDFSLPRGSDVLSTGAGEVISVRRSRTYGVVIDIRHTNEVITRYAHLSKALVSKGQTVYRGQRIALVGNTGRSTGPHLHYEVRVRGRTVDPMKFIALADKLDRIV